MNDKPAPMFVGSVKEGKFPQTYDIGFSRAHLHLLLAKLDESGRDYVNVQLKHSQKSQKPYMQIRPEYAKSNVNKQPEKPSEPIDEEELPF